MPRRITYDARLIADIAARFDLRAPNVTALTDIVKWLATDRAPDDTEAVADLATGVGKTYLMSSLVDYVATQGIRNVLVVTPGSTIQRKTLDNFDAASHKYVPGADFVPHVITPENFQTARTGTVLHDRTAVKVFVFNVQQLIAPSAESSRRTREVDENLGGPLYEHLQRCEDLIVIADEHHLYSEKARSFNAAINDLSPLALIGLTATPTQDHISKIRSQYTLGQAIADGYVKVPVIVYRKDGTRDERTQLRDACALLRVKEAAYAAYTSATSATSVKPALFVVCSSIERADAVGALLAQPGYLGDPGAVLHITSQSSDEALAALADVENPDSPIRAIVSVNMLKEGWDVKNIAVIVALRKLASQTLTEQILGRGLRLPFGARTGVPAVDQVDLVAHDSYGELLRQKDVLAQRLQVTPAIEEVDEHGAAPATATNTEDAAAPASDGTAVDAASAEGSIRTNGDSDSLTIETRDGDPAIQFSETTTRSNTPPPMLVYRAEGAPQIHFPRRQARLSRVDFELANVSTAAAEAAGRQFRADVPTFIFRDALDAENVGDDVRITVRPQAHAEATQELVAVTRVRDDLVETIRRQPEVPKTRESANGCKRLVAAFLGGAGVSDESQTAEWSEKRRAAAIEGIRALIREAIRNRETKMEHVLVGYTMPNEPALVPGDTRDAYNDDFVKHAPFTGWQRSIMPAAEFDAKSTEWELAHLLDRDPAIEWWLRLTPSDPAFITVDGGGRYFPDFIALATDGTHWLIEGKSDKASTDSDVRAKRDAAETWARAVQDSDNYPTWRYLFATESDLRAAAGSFAALVDTVKPE